MKRLKQNISLLLVLFLCFGLVACSNHVYFKDDDVVTGKDWRVTGVVRGDGTIIRDDTETFVLVCVDKEGAYFYYDEEEQTLFDFVHYPIITESDAWDAFKGVHFDDIDGDGNSDVTIYLNDAGVEYEITWIWHATEGYVLADGWSNS